MEPRVLRECTGITSVSPEYPEQLKKRYAWLGDLPCLVQPFPGAKRDFERLSSSKIRQHVFDPNDGNVHWVYVGVVVPGMLPVLRCLFRVLVTQEYDDLRSKLRFHFVGTSYVPGERASPQVLPLAQEFGLVEQVDERTGRIPYVEALKCLSDADALIAIGSDDPGYTASKIYPYLLAHKPMLAVYHEYSSVVKLLGKVKGAVCLPFLTPLDVNSLMHRIDKYWLADDHFLKPVLLNESAFKAYTDRESAALICRFLMESLSNAKT